MNIQNVKMTLNLCMREWLRILKLEANVNGMTEMRSPLKLSLNLKKQQSLKALVRKLEVNGKEISD